MGIGKRIKRTWRKTSTRRKVRGFFGPGKKTIDASIRNLRRGESTGIANSRAARIAAKYSLDALHIIYQPAREEVFDLLNKYSSKLTGFFEAGGRKEPPVFKQQLLQDLSQILGIRLSELFYDLYEEKFNKIRKRHMSQW